MSSIKIDKIVLPSLPQADTIVATFLLIKYGTKYEFSENLSFEIWQKFEKNEEELLSEGVLLLDAGGGKYDHHTKDTTASLLVAEDLCISDDPSIQKLLQYAERDDKYGKGTMSDDPLDRAFGLSGLISCLKKGNIENPTKIVNIVLPLLEAHHEEESKRTKEMPLLVEKLKKENKFTEFQTKQRDKKVKVVIFEDEDRGLPGYLRSKNGGAYDFVVQIFSSGHVNILTLQYKKFDLRSLVVEIRKTELDYSPYAFMGDLKELSVYGKIDEIPEWYYDTATNSILNGGIDPRGTEPTKIEKNKWPEILENGITEKNWQPYTKRS